MKNQYIVDRFEEEYVVCEDETKQMHDFKRCEFPENIKAGDVVIKKDHGFVIDEQMTDDRTKKIKSMMDSLWED